MTCYVLSCYIRPNELRQMFTLEHKGPTLRNSESFQGNYREITEGPHSGIMDIIDRKSTRLTFWFIMFANIIHQKPTLLPTG